MAERKRNTRTAGERTQARNNAGGTRGKPFTIGNPGRPAGARNKATVAIEALLDGEAEAIGRKCIEMALGGDATAMRLAMERIAPVRRGRPVTLSLPAISTASDVVSALGAVISAVAQGEITPDEAATVATVLEAKRRAIETVELEERVAALEERGGRRDS